ncbi:site-specific integrase [Chitinophaga japonensis]|uniref:Site-specific recombinase XerD n=1 Tax=Chitinophaga japonensis TaxID=104662 RepID=A0A562T6W6_CHIJA|nr:site-specific integrase [Chitinophaga japonensis]TWI89287.1 site-specific recombinase XerD [Chitinophaga japonensis]
MKVNEKLSILLILEKSKMSQDGKAPITVRITIDGKRAELSLGLKTTPQNWNQEAGRAIGNAADARQINAVIDRVKAALKKHYDMLCAQHDYVSATMVKIAFQGKKPVESKTLLETLGFMIEKLEKKVEKGKRAKGTLSRWKTTKAKVADFLGSEYKRKDILLDQIVYAFAEDFADYLTLEQGLENNTAMKYLKNVKQTLKAATERDWLDKSPLAGYKCSYFNPERDILDEMEIMQLYHKKLPIARLVEVRDAYLFMCFTGYAYKDASLLQPAHVTKHFDGEDWIIKNREKTWCRENVPLLPIAKEIVERYKNNAYCIANNVLLPIKSNQKMNSYLKELAELCGIEKNLTTHTARHTFATTVTLANGVPLETVSALLGHKSIRTTQIYAKIVAKKISQDMQALKQRLELKMPVSMLKKKAV